MSRLHHVLVATPLFWWRRSCFVQTIMLVNTLAHEFMCPFGSSELSSSSDNNSDESKLNNSYICAILALFVIFVAGFFHFLCSGLLHSSGGQKMHTPQLEHGGFLCLHDILVEKQERMKNNMRHLTCFCARIDKKTI